METHARLTSGPPSKFKLVKKYPGLYSIWTPKHDTRKLIFICLCSISDTWWLQESQPCNSYYSFMYFHEYIFPLKCSTCYRYNQINDLSIMYYLFVDSFYICSLTFYNYYPYFRGSKEFTFYCISLWYESQMQDLSENTSEKRIAAPTESNPTAGTFTAKPVLRPTSLKRQEPQWCLICILSSTLSLLSTELHSTQEAIEVAILKWGIRFRNI